MRIVFMGTPDFSVSCLESLLNANHNVCAVFSQPDKPVGRKQILTPPPVKAFALEHNIPVFQPLSLRDESVKQKIEEFKADVIVVVAYGKILPPDMLNMCRFGCINVHASILPEYRGAAPIQWAILDGKKETGVTIMKMNEGIDTGDIILIEKTPITQNETSEELFNRLAKMGGTALIKALEKIENNTATYQKQPDGDFGYAKMITKELSPIDWSKSAESIHNKIRGLQTWPCALTTVNGKNIKIHKSELCDTDAKGKKYGEVVKSGNELIVFCGDGKCIRILEVQLEGKKRMSIKDFLLGNKIEVGAILGD